MTVNNLKTALTWVEQVWFAECPECKASVELGTDVTWKKGDDCFCEECDADFLLSEQAS